MSLLPDLEAELRRAARRTQPHPNGRVSLRRSRWLVAVAAAAALSGTAAAAVLSLKGEPSRPLAGTFPGDSGPSARAYRVTLTPDLRAGAAGWCLSVRLTHGIQPTGAAAGCGPAPPSSAAVIGGGLLSGPDGLIVWAVVDRRVAVVRLGDGRRILPRADPGLPFGWRAIVAFGRTNNRRETLRLSLLNMRMFNTHGQLISQHPNQLAGTHRADTYTLPTRHLRSTEQARCVIHHRNLPGLSAQGQQVVVGRLAPSQVDVNGRAFRTCSAAVFRLSGITLRAAVLVDAANPSRQAADLPKSPFISARRIGNAWLLVTGPDRGIRRRLLASLSATAR